MNARSILARQPRTSQPPVWNGQNRHRLHSIHPKAHKTVLRKCVYIALCHSCRRNGQTCSPCSTDLQNCALLARASPVDTCSFMPCNMQHASQTPTICSSVSAQSIMPHRFSCSRASVPVLTSTGTPRCMLHLTSTCAVQDVPWCGFRGGLGAPKKIALLRMLCCEPAPHQNTLRNHRRTWPLDLLLSCATLVTTGWGSKSLGT